MDLGNDSSKPIPDRWTLVVKTQKDGSSLSYYYCPESGQRFDSHDDLIRYVNYAKAAELSIYARDFIPRNPRKSKKKAGTSELEETEKSSDSDDSMFKLPTIESLEALEETSSVMPEKQPAPVKNKLEKKKKHGSNEGCSSNKGKAKKQKK